jgi:hypothetical protein
MDPNFAGGGVTLRFFCMDMSGHAVVEIRINSAAERVTNRWSCPAQSALFWAFLEANAMDEFVRDLRTFEPYEPTVASLKFRKPSQ